MEEQTESWRLRSGTWYRDPKSERWRLAAARNGTVANAKLSTEDIGRLIGAKRDTSSGHWFPSDFNYSPQTGALLHAPIPSLDSTWIPPFGAPALCDITKPSARGLRQTPAPLALARSKGRFHLPNEAERTLPALPPGQYHFLVHKFDVVAPTLMAIKPHHGIFLVLLPESKAWVALERSALGEGLKNARGWRMEIVEGARYATLYLPTARGLAAVTPSLIGLSYAVEYFGEGPALGAPVARAGKVWLPVLGNKGGVKLVGKRRGTATPIILPTSAPAPKNGFEAPVFNSVHVIWPSDEGQLIVRLDQDGNREADWIPWPDGLRPAFSLGCAYASSGLFFQPCWSGQNGSLEYVQMGEPAAHRTVVDAPRLSTGYVSYKGEQRIDGDPWREPEQPLNRGSSEVVVPIIELGRAVIGLRIEAPHGVLSLLESDKERHRAVLQLEAENRPAVRFGTLNVARPWLASVFVYDSHLWVYHPDLPQPLGWELET